MELLVYFVVDWPHQATAFKASFRPMSILSFTAVGSLSRELSGFLLFKHGLHLMYNGHGVESTAMGVAIWEEFLYRSAVWGYILLSSYRAIVKTPLPISLMRLLTFLWIFSAPRLRYGENVLNWASRASLSPSSLWTKWDVMQWGLFQVMAIIHVWAVVSPWGGQRIYGIPSEFT